MLFNLSNRQKKSNAFKQVEKFCEACSKKLELRRSLDITRKRFCSHLCKGKINGKKRLGQRHSIETRQKISADRIAFFKRNPDAKEFAANQLRKMRRNGMKNTVKHNEAVSRGAKRHSALDLPNCKCWIHTPKGNAVSKLSWKLVDFLVDAGFEVVIPEAQFGRYRIDALLAEEWIAFEADGKYWHDGKYDADRDAKLLNQFKLPVIRLTEEEINAF